MLKNLTIDQEKIEEKLIEEIVSPFVRYDPKRKSIILLVEKTKNLKIPQKVLLCLFALKGWRFFDLKEIPPEEAMPKEIALSIGENSSTVRNHLQVLRREGLIYKTNSGAYTILSHSAQRIKETIEGKETLEWKKK